MLALQHMMRMKEVEQQQVTLNVQNNETKKIYYNSVTDEVICSLSTSVLQSLVSKVNQTIQDATQSEEFQKMITSQVKENLHKVIEASEVVTTLRKDTKTLQEKLDQSQSSAIQEKDNEIQKLKETVEFLESQVSHLKKQKVSLPNGPEPSKDTSILYEIDKDIDEILNGQEDTTDVDEMVSKILNNDAEPEPEVAVEEEEEPEPEEAEEEEPEPEETEEEEPEPEEAEEEEEDENEEEPQE